MRRGGLRLPAFSDDELGLGRHGAMEPGDDQERRAALDFRIARIDLDLGPAARPEVIDQRPPACDRADGLTALTSTASNAQSAAA